MVNQSQRECADILPRGQVKRFGDVLVAGTDVAGDPAYVSRQLGGLFGFDDFDESAAFAQANAFDCERSGGVYGQRVVCQKHQYNRGAEMVQLHVRDPSRKTVRAVCSGKVNARCSESKSSSARTGDGMFMIVALRECVALRLVAG